MENIVYFVYQHVRLDTNEIFYIGVGTKNKGNTLKSKYKRAYSKSGRNNNWKRIVNIYNYKIEILEEFNDIIDCLKAETDLIDFYGRISENSGNLVNLVRDNSEIEEKRIKNLKLSLEKLKKKTYKYCKEGFLLEEYSSLTEAAIKNNTLPTDILNCITGRNYLTVGFQWKYKKFDKIHSYDDIKRKLTNNIEQYDFNHKLIKKWKSVEEASIALNISNSAIRNNLCGLSNSCNGYLWIYEGNKLTNVPYVLKVYDLQYNFIGKYHTFKIAEKELGLKCNTISVYLQRQKPHFKYIFKSIKEKTSEYLKSKKKK
jgi:hypothetical protein